MKLEWKNHQLGDAVIADVIDGYVKMIVKSSLMKELKPYSVSINCAESGELKRRYKTREEAVEYAEECADRIVDAVEAKIDVIRAREKSEKENENDIL